jgi:SAM-dependent methyltransferase
MSIEESDAPAIDLGRLQAEINEEVRHRRASGDFPPGLERELDAMFARYAPAGTGDDFDEVLSAAETTSFIHADVPTASRLLPLVYAKKLLRKAMAWYLRFLAQEVTAFAGAITRAVKLLAQRVDVLETVTVVAAERTLAEIRERRAGPDLGPWSAVVVDALAGAPGRVLHTECGAGTILAALAGAGTDVYGIEPAESLATEASRAGLDVRTDDALPHLRALPDATLGGLVLSGCVDALPLGEILEVADRAAAVLVPGGRLVLLSTGPAAWARTHDPVVADLAPGRPLHPETWRHLLGQRGFGEATVETGASDAALGAVPPETPGAAILNANIERLNQLLFAPAGYALVATKR